MKINSNPKVSVCVVAYNHERYIRDCLQSLVEQETNFTFEIIVGEDCSTDGTRLIIEEFAKNYPDLVRPIYHVKNVGAADNYYSVHAAAAGKYIAHLDGDDYALAGKLQMQADYLDTHPDCNIVWHRMKIEYEKTGELLDDLIDLSCFPSGGVVREDLLEFITFGLHSSKMYRAGLREFDKPNFQVLDFYINVMQIGNGRACLLGGQPLGVYRAGIGFASSGSTSNILLCKTLLYFSKIYKESRPSIAAAALIKCLAALKNRRWLEFRCYFILTLRVIDISTVFKVWKNRKLYAMLRLPRKYARPQE